MMMIYRRKSIFFCVTKVTKKSTDLGRNQNIGQQTQTEKGKRMLYLGVGAGEIIQNDAKDKPKEK